MFCFSIVPKKPFKTQNRRSLSSSVSAVEFYSLSVCVVISKKKPENENRNALFGIQSILDGQTNVEIEFSRFWHQKTIGVNYQTKFKRFKPNRINVVLIFSAIKNLKVHGNYLHINGNFNAILCSPCYCLLHSVLGTFGMMTEGALSASESPPALCRMALGSICEFPLGFLRAGRVVHTMLIFF